jgi:hypothetical protein
MISYMGVTDRPLEDTISPEKLRDLMAMPPPAESGNLLPWSAFEDRAAVAEAWAIPSANLQLDPSTPHTGRRSLPLPAGLKQSVALEIPLDPDLSGAVRFATWARAEDLVLANDRSLLALTLYYSDGSTETVALPVPPGSYSWQHPELVHVPGKQPTAATLQLDPGAVVFGSVWLDDLYLGASPLQQDGSSARDQITWYNTAHTLDFSGKPLVQVDDGPWENRASVTLATEGLHELRVRARTYYRYSVPQTIGIDLTLPEIRITTEPYLDQRVSIYYGTPETLFSLTATDQLSGVASLEVSLDQEEWEPYAGPFTLSPGSHELRVRATDRAGNVQETMTGEVLTAAGGQSRSVNLEIQ